MSTIQRIFISASILSVLVAVSLTLLLAVFELGEFNPNKSDVKFLLGIFSLATIYSFLVLVLIVAPMHHVLANLEIGDLFIVLLVSMVLTVTIGLLTMLWLYSAIGGIFIGGIYHYLHSKNSCKNITSQSCRPQKARAGTAYTPLRSVSAAPY